MTNQHPITPPPDLIEQWQDESLETQIVDHIHYLAICAAQWGADQELEACCKVLEYQFMADSIHLRAIRRPKPPSLKEQALKALKALDHRVTQVAGTHADTIRRALDALPDDTPQQL
jgi:hypothetical protein